MIIVYAILIICLLALTVFFGKKLYDRSVHIRNRLQMDAVFTNITHELLTPLTVISASVERLRTQEPKYGTDYALMELNIERMVRLLQQILETSKAQSGELKLLVSQGDVMKYIRQTALCIEPLMAKRNLQFVVRCQPESMMGWIDTDKVDKIIYNLLSNAAKYTGEHGHITLDVRTNKTYDRITIRVIDNGIGIPPEKMKNLFQRFYDGDYRRQKTIGTGLGLALTRELVFLHGGTIQVESELNHGTTFTIKLPINKESFSKSQIDDRNKTDFRNPHSNILDIGTLPSLTDTDQQTGNEQETDEDIYKLLIVEDNVELLMLMKQLLGTKYRVYTATNGIEALDIVKKEELDLIVSDVMMPKMDGNALTRHLKSNPDTSHIPIILLTAKTQEADRNKSFIEGADDYITKPFRMGDLELRINNIIENRQRIQQEYKSQRQPLTKPENTPLNPDDEFLQKAYNCVREHLADSDFDRDAFAADMGASASTLYNKLRSITGFSVSAFIRDIRMKEAYRMATETPSIRVSDLAYRVGFSDPKYFSSCFKKEFGLLPSEFLESLETPK